MGRLACISKKLCSVMHDFYYKTICTKNYRILVSDLLSNDVSTSPPGGWAALFKILFCFPGLVLKGVRVEVSPEDNRVVRSHLACGRLEFSFEQGNNLLDDRFSRNCLYTSNWPSCVHIDKNHNYMLFEGNFINFKKTMIWRALNDHGNEYKVALSCAFCSCMNTWDLYSPSGFNQFLGLEDGEPVDRAFVCENGHVFGAWTDWFYDPLITPIWSSIRCFLRLL